MEVRTSAIEHQPGVVAEGSPVVARTWRLSAARGRLMLTGLYGFPWPGPVLEARCLRKDAAHGDLLGPRRMVDRYHRIVPDAACTCGIYGSVDPAGRWPRSPLVRSQPVVRGFVELSGRIVTDGTIYRAQIGTILGPLQILFPRPAVRRRPAFDRLDHVAEDGGQFTLAKSKGVALSRWLERTKRELVELYQTEVL